MKLEKKKLQKIINEEFKRARSRVTQGRLLNESVKEADSYDLIRFAKAYAKLGWAVQEQLMQLINGDPDEMHGINPNAVEVMKQELLGLNDDIDRAFEYYDEDFESSSGLQPGELDADGYDEHGNYKRG